MKVFVTGIHTDAGKSYATGWLADKINADGGNAITMKFVQTGNKVFSEDIDVHRKIMGTGLLPVDKQHITAPEIFSYPCSPDLAARIDGRDIDFDKIDSAVEELEHQYETVIIEGAGGIMVPLKDDYLTIDYIKERGLPVILVTNGSLGSINHTLLTLQAIKDYGIDLKSIIYNAYFDNDKIIAEDTRNYIIGYLKKNFKDAQFLVMEKMLI